jgi:hypothetical protein
MDLLFVDFTYNDGFEDSIRGNSRVRLMERLLRKVLALPRAPAVVHMHSGGHMHTWHSNAVSSTCDPAQQSH